VDTSIDGRKDVAHYKHKDDFRMQEAESPELEAFALSSDPSSNSNGKVKAVRT
jgi:hypothetical protein